MPIAMGKPDFKSWRGNATMLFYMSEEGQEGNAYVEKRPPDFSKYPRRP